MGFFVLAIGVFKPFGLDAWDWKIFVHLLAIWVMGFGICMLTELILKYVVRMPRSYDHGVSYIIRRNLWFQLINTPLAALSICLYRHFIVSSRAEGNQLSWSNYLETLLILAFCSFAIGLYWRFKFRSKYLTIELEETRQLNEQLKKSQPTGLSESLTLTGTTNESVTLQISHLLYIEAVGNYVKVHYWHDDQIRSDMLRATSKQMEEKLQSYKIIVRCHRAFLVNLAQVEQIVSRAGTMQLLMKHCNASIPVSRSNMAQIKEAIKGV